MQNGVDRYAVCLCECAQRGVAFYTYTALLLASVVIIFQVFCQSVHPFCLIVTSLTGFYQILSITWIHLDHGNQMLIITKTVQLDNEG